MLWLRREYDRVAAVWCRALVALESLCYWLRLARVRCSVVTITRCTGRRGTPAWPRVRAIIRNVWMFVGDPLDRERVCTACDLM